MREQHPAWEGEALGAAKFSSIIANLGQWRHALLNGDFASVAREQQLQLLPKLWSSGMKPAAWAAARTAGAIKFSTPPKALPTAQVGDLVVATDNSSDRRAYGLGRIGAVATDDDGNTVLPVDWVVTILVEFTENTYATGPFSKSSKLDLTIAAFEAVQPGLLAFLMAGTATSANEEAEVNATSGDSIASVGDEQAQEDSLPPPSSYTPATARAEGVFMPEDELTAIDLLRRHSLAIFGNATYH